MDASVTTWEGSACQRPRSLQHQGGGCITLKCLQDGDECQAQVGVREPGV